MLTYKAHNEMIKRGIWFMPTTFTVQSSHIFKCKLYLKEKGHDYY